MRIGESQVRVEDDRLLRGGGRYTADHKADGEARMVILRAPLAAGRITELDISDARDMPGIIDIITHADLKQEGIGPILPVIRHPGPDGGEMYAPEFMPLAGERVMHVGEPVAAIIAESLAEAEAALEAIILEIDEDPSVWKPSSRTPRKSGRKNPTTGSSCSSRATQQKSMTLFQRQHISSRNAFASPASPPWRWNPGRRWQAMTRAPNVSGWFMAHNQHTGSRHRWLQSLA